MRREENLLKEVLGNALAAIEGDFLFLLALDVIKRNRVVEIVLVLMEAQPIIGTKIAFGAADKGGRSAGTAIGKFIGTQAQIPDQEAAPRPS